MAAQAKASGCRRVAENHAVQGWQRYVQDRSRARSGTRAKKITCLIYLRALKLSGLALRAAFVAGPSIKRSIGRNKLEEDSLRAGCTTAG